MYVFVQVHLLNKSEKYLGALQSPCALVLGCWELSHVIFLMLRKKELHAKVSKFTERQLFSFKMAT